MDYGQLSIETEEGTALDRAGKFDKNYPVVRESSHRAATPATPVPAASRFRRADAPRTIPVTPVKTLADPTPPVAPRSPHSMQTHLHRALIRGRSLSLGESLIDMLLLDLFPPNRQPTPRFRLSTARAQPSDYIPARILATLEPQ
jgi:hypothetical protein